VEQQYLCRIIGESSPRAVSAGGASSYQSLLAPHRGALLIRRHGSQGERMGDCEAVTV
jgi:hypothetical protein